MNKPKNGRPKKRVVKTELTKLCEIRCSLSEIAYYFSVSEKTIERRCEKWFGSTFVEFRRRTLDGTKLALKRQLFKRAMDGGDKVLLVLAEQHGLINENGNDGYSSEVYDSGEVFVQRIKADMTPSKASLIYKDLIKKTKGE